MAIVRVKNNNVKLKNLTQAMAWMLYTLELMARRANNVVNELVITSINDGTHAMDSRHYKDEAIDVRSKNFGSREDKRWFRAAFEDALGPKFRVLLEHEGLENEHFHVQVRKGEVYP